ncbi:PaaI family thioesterase [Chloroflexota bacterium]
MSEARDWESEMMDMNNAPYFKLLGMRVVALSEGYSRLVVPIDESMNSRNGALHGGVLSSLADSAVAMALFAMIKPDEKPLTIDLNINYLRPVQGDQVTAEANIISRGRTIAVGVVDITDKSGRLVAKSRATYMIAA